MPKKIKIDWKTVAVAGLATIAVALSASSLVAVTRQEKTVDIGASAYQIAGVDDSGYLDKEDETSIVTKQINADGLEITASDEKSVNYIVHAYDKDGKLISSSEVQTGDYDASMLPEKTETVRVEIICPTWDEDQTISWTEKFDYAKLLTIKTNK